MPEVKAATGPLYELLNEDGDIYAFSERLMNLPAMHARVVKP